MPCESRKSYRGRLIEGETPYITDEAAGSEGKYFTSVFRTVDEACEHNQNAFNVLYLFHFPELVSQAPSGPGQSQPAQTYKREIPRLRDGLLLRTVQRCVYALLTLKQQTTFC